MVKLSNERQARMARSPICVTELGMVKFCKWLQSSNAPFPMWVTDFGMVNVFNAQRKKAWSPM